MIDNRLLEICATQYGAVAIEQLNYELGMTSSGVHRMRSSGLLAPVTSNVLRITSTRESFLTRCMAVQLHTGGDGFLSGWTAGRLHGLRQMSTSRIHYTVPARARIVLPDWVSLHRSRWYNARRDRQRLGDGLLVAVAPRMLFALGAVFNQQRFERAAEDAWHLGLTSPSEMATYLDLHRCRGKDGVAKVERWLDHALDQDRPAQSGLEIELIQALLRARLPNPVRQHPLVVHTGETIHLDIAWPRIRLAIEPGATWWHGGDERQRRDQRRDLACSELGWLIVRLDESLRNDVGAVANRIRAIHRRRSLDLDHPGSVPL